MNNDQFIDTLGIGRLGHLGEAMWYCAQCGEEIEDTFEACWNCGTGEDGIVAPDF